MMMIRCHLQPRGGMYIHMEVSWDVKRYGLKGNIVLKWMIWWYRTPPCHILSNDVQFDGIQVAVSILQSERYTKHHQIMGLMSIPHYQGLDSLE